VNVVFTDHGNVICHGTQTVHSRASASTTDPVTLDYVGPGSSVAHLVIAPKSVTMIAPTSVMLAINLVNATPSNGSAAIVTSRGAMVNWLPPSAPRRN